MVQSISNSESQKNPKPKYLKIVKEIQLTNVNISTIEELQTTRKELNMFSKLRTKTSEISVFIQLHKVTECLIRLIWNRVETEPFYKRQYAYRV